MDIKELLKILFPEYQIFQAAKEYGFIARNIQRADETDSNISGSGNRYTASPDQVCYTGGGQHTASSVNFQQCTSYTKVTREGSTSSWSTIEQQESSAVNSSQIKSAETVSSERHTSERTSVDSSDIAFSALCGELSRIWVGSQKDISAICDAFRRPYIQGYDGIKPRNVILLIGSESRGRKYAVECISDILKRKKIFRSEEVSVLTLSDYGSDTSDILFLSDLYQALNRDSDSILIEQIDVASVQQLNILYQLFSTGTYKMSKRYMVNGGGLTEATGALNTDLVSSIQANGKFFVLLTTLPQGKIVQQLGNRITNEIGDIITMDPLTPGQTVDLAHMQCMRMSERCKDYLKLSVGFDDSLFYAVAEEYNTVTGIGGMEKFIDRNLYQPLAELKLKGAIWDDEFVTFTYDEDYYIRLDCGERFCTADLLHDYNEAELLEVKRELDEVIGLTEVKQYVMDLENNYRVQRMRSESGLQAASISMHMIFTGNPGTGKTTIARIVAKYLKAIGVLSSGHLREVSRSNLVGQYAGHTAQKTTDVIQSSLGGVLFIDEAYSLCRDQNDPFGLEAIDTLVKGMEDHRDDLVVILAGYEDEMQEFLKANTGLKSRFPNIVHFKDYTPEEMYEIARVTAASKGYQIAPDCRDALLSEFERHQIRGRNDSGNGRLVRNLIEKAILNQSRRIANESNPNLELLLKEDFGLTEIPSFDLEKSLAEVVGMEEVKRFIRSQHSVLQADRKRRAIHQEADTTQSLNMIFAGNPGTGKTTMARIMAEMFRSMGILKSGQLIETDRGGLVSGYLGQTAAKTEEVFKSALGGVLFIDEAYSITGSGDPFGKECIDTLVKLIEDFRREIVVILAGYSHEMQEFLKANSGLASRFPIKIDFPDYTADELYAIGIKMIAERGFVLTEDADAQFKEEIIQRKRQADAESGNGRMIRNFVEEIIRNQSVRIAADAEIETELTVIEEADIRPEITRPAVFDLEAELSKVVGLESVKRYIRSLNARLRLQEERKKAGLRTGNTQTMHMIFAGNPGTGKTMMARMVANVLYNMNVIRTNTLVETDRSGLVAGYVGQTALKTRQVIESALDGVLFIDEAYSLAQGGTNDFGQEAIDTLVKMMDDNRDRLVVILAGYSEDMRRFLASNAGLQSRFANIIEFPDYTTEELMQIAEGMFTSHGYVLSEEGKSALYEKLECARRTEHFGNGRYVRNIFERSLNNQALRLNGETSFTTEALTVITESDIREA